MGKDMRRFITAKRDTRFKQGLIDALALPGLFACLQGCEHRKR